MKTTGYLGNHPESRPRIFAHRGLTFSGNTEVADENTLKAFELALAAGADYLESDIQVTSDQVPVLFHDRDLKRLLGRKTKISELSWAEVQSIRLPLQGQIPTLERALELFPQAKFNLDIKTPQAETVGIKTISELGASDRVLVSSFSERSRKRALANSGTSLATSAGSSKVLASYLLARAKSIRNLQNQLIGIDALQIPTERYGIDFTHPKFLEQILPLGVEIHYWTINDPIQMQELFGLGAHGIVTDRTDLAIKAFS
jgi:glycerophosphoryl diester phosphodiesterase